MAFADNKKYDQSVLVENLPLGIGHEHWKHVAPTGIRMVHLSSSDVGQLADVAYTLQQYPRVKFEVVCMSLMCSEGSSAHAALHSVLTTGMV